MDRRSVFTRKKEEEVKEQTDFMKIIDGEEDLRPGFNGGNTLDRTKW